jgi:LuxR family maltose regulon positive regulatory protein
LIAAPPGSGKARLVTYWLARHPEYRWSWIDFDPEDRATRTPFETPAELIPDIQPGESDDVIVIAGLEVLSTDDLTGVLARLPAAVRVILLSAGPGLPASSVVRLADDLAELRTADLWWPQSVIAARLSRLTGLEATDDECRHLYRLTAGWPAGVIILGRAMRHRPVLQAAGESSSDPEVLDFVTHEVLDRLVDPIRRFMLRTSVLADLEPGPCAALEPAANPHAMLAELQRQGLIVGGRYPPMIRAAARRALRSELSGLEGELLRTAGEYARRHDQDQAAVSCFVDAGEWEPAIEVLTSAAAGGFRGWSSQRLHQSLEQVPEHVWGQDAERRVLIAFAAAISGDPLLAAEVIHQTPAALSGAMPWWPALTLTIQALAVGGPGRNAYQTACAALVEVRQLDEQAPIPALLGAASRASLGALLHLLAARASLFEGDLEGVRRHLDAGWGRPEAQIPRYGMLVGLGTDALASAWAGSLGAGLRRAGRAQRLAEQTGLLGHPMMGLALLAGVELLRARGRTGEALAELDAGSRARQRNEIFVAALSGGQLHQASERILRAALLLDRADPAAAKFELDLLAADGDDELPIPLEAARVVAWARLHVQLDDVAAADRVLLDAPTTGLVVATRVALALQCQAPQRAAEILGRWPAAEAAETLDSRLRLLLASAAVALALDRRQEGGALVDGALAAAEPDGHIQVFLESPASVRVLTTVALRRSDRDSPWRQELAGRLDEIRLRTDADSVPVTRRELAVLERLTTSLTHAQIATGMFVSENTLKSHCRNLYRKLGVNSRADAVRAAQARGWLALP